MKPAVFVVILAAGAVALAASLAADRPAKVVVAQAPAAAPPASGAPAAAPAKLLPDNPGFYAGEAGLSPSELAGREIWYKATAGNARFHTYVFQQRVGVLVDWFRVLRADQRDDRFAAYGLINDPGCCTPGTDGCPAKSLDETYGLRLVPGRRGAAQVRRPRGLPRPGVRFPRSRGPSGRSPPQGEGPAAVVVRPRLRHVHRSARLPQVPQPPLRPRPLAEGERRPRELGRLREDAGHRSEVRGLARAPARRRFDRAAVPDRHVLRLLPHRVRPAESPGRPRASQVGEHQGRDRQPVPAHLRDPRLGDALRLARVPDVLARAPGHVRHLGDPDRPGVEPRDDQRHPSTSTSAPSSRARTSSSGARSRPARRTPAAGTKCWCEPGRDGKCWLQSRAKESSPSHPEGRRGLDRHPRGHPAGVLQHRLVLGGLLAQSPHRHAPARPAGAQLRPDAVRHRAVPPRLPELPRDRGSPPRHRRVPVLEGNRRDRPRRRARERAESAERERALYARRPRRRPRPAVRQREGRGRARPRGVRGQLRALPLEHSRHAGERVQEPRLPRARRQAASAATGSATTSRRS